MFIGHGLLAFALVAAAAKVAGWPADRALAVGVLAAGFGMAPDVDIVYGPVGVLGATSLLGAAEGFWTAGNLVHRAVTHSLLVGAVGTVAVTLWTRGSSPPRGVALGLMGALVGVAAVGSLLAGIVMGGFALALLVLAGIGRRLAFEGRIVGLAALVGLWTHPFGDLFTGQPPALLYPLDATVFAERVILHPDPTMHLLAALGIELTTAWLALAVLLHLRGSGLDDHLTPRAAFGATFGSVVFLLPPPTLEMSYHFVFPLLGLALGCAVGIRPSGWRTLWTRRRDRWIAALATGLAAVTLATVAYAVMYRLF